MEEGEHTSVLAFISSPRNFPFGFFHSPWVFNRELRSRLSKSVFSPLDTIYYASPTPVLSPDTFHTLFCESHRIDLITSLLFWGDFCSLNPLVSLWPNIYSYYCINWHRIVYHFAKLSEFSLLMCALYSWLFCEKMLCTLVARLNRECWIRSGHFHGEEYIYWSALKRHLLGSWGNLTWFPCTKCLKSLGHLFQKRQRLMGV